MLGEQWRIAQENIKNESLVGFRAGLGEGRSIREVHRDIAKFHLGAGHFGAEFQSNSLIRLNTQYDGVGAESCGI